MTLAFPLGLIGLLSLPAILALHLIRQRQRRYVVSDLGLWSFLDQARRGPRPRRLPLTWLLLLDLTAAALFTLAWTQPRLQAALPAFQGRQQVILLDVSTSMLARQGLGDRLSQARTEAEALLANAGPRDIITLVTFDRTARSLGDSRQVSLEELSHRLQSVQAGGTGYALQEAVALGLAAVDGARPVEFHILTDGAFPEEAAAGLEALKYPVKWRMAGELQDNEAVLELNATSLGENRLQVFARFANFGSAWSRRQVLLQADGQTVARARLELPAESTVPQVWQVTGEYRSVTVALQGDDVLPEDDSATIGIQLGGEEEVALVAEQPAPLQQALQAVPGVKLQTILPGDYHPTEVQPPPALTVFRGFLPETLPDGPVLVVEPPEATDQGDNQLAVSGRVSIPAEALLQFPTPDQALAGVDFNGVRWGRAWELPAIPDGFLPLLRAGQAPLLLRGENAGAPLWVLLSDLDRGNFTQHPAFPILIANFVLQARGAPLPASLLAGEALVLPGAGQDGRLQVIAPGGGPVDVASSSGAWYETRRPGLYRVILDPAGQARQEFLTGVNAGDADESDLRPRAWIQTAGQEGARAAGLARPAVARTEADPPIELAPWLLGAALLVLFLEARLAWR